MKTWHRTTQLLAIIGLLATVGCATMPRTPQQALYLAEVQYSALVRAATDAIDQGVVDVDTARSIQRAAHEAERYLGAAWAAYYAADTAGVDSQLAGARAAILSIRDMLYGGEQ